MKALKLLCAAAAAMTILALQVACGAQPVVRMSEAALSNFNAQVAQIYAQKEVRSVAELKLDSSCLLAADGKAASKTQKTAQLRGDGTILCNIYCQISDRLLKLIREHGTVLAEVRECGIVRANVSPSGLLVLAADPDVKSIRRALPSEHNKLTTSQGVAGHKAGTARTKYGVTGKGIMVGVISDGVDDLATLQKSGDLPSNAAALSGHAGTGNEGAAMMEVVYDMAPDVTLRFSDAGMSCDEFAAAIRRLQEAGCKVIVDDLTRPDDPAFEDGAISQAINAFVAAGGIYVTDAANRGALDGVKQVADDVFIKTTGTWQGEFVASSRKTKDKGEYIAHAPAPRSSGAWGYGMEWFNPIDEPNLNSAAGTTTISLQWSDKWGASGNDYDLFVVDLVTGNVIGSSAVEQSGKGDPIELVVIENARLIGKAGRTPLDSYVPGVAVYKKKSAANCFLRVEVYRGRVSYQTEGAISGHDGCENAITCGASKAPEAGAFPKTFFMEDFSADGPAYRFYDANGKSIGKKVINKPDVTGADGVSCSATGFETFNGTSAAAPHVAGIVALMLEANPKLTAAAVRTILINSTICERPGWDRNSGYGVPDAALCVKNAKAYKPAYTVAFAGNGATSGSMSLQMCERGKIYTLAKCAFRKTGKTFKGWAGSNGKRYDDGVLVFNAAAEGATLTLTAIWE